MSIFTQPSCLPVVVEVLTDLFRKWSLFSFLHQHLHCENVEEDSSRSDVKDKNLCLAAVQKLVEYIKLNFVETDTGLTASTSRTTGLVVDIHALSLRSDGGDGDLGLSFGNIPIFGDPDRNKNSGLRRRWAPTPVMDVGHIWVTEVRKESPAARCGGIKLRDELLSLNGQLMVGVDVAGARYPPFSSASDICPSVPYVFKLKRTHEYEISIFVLFFLYIL